MAFEVVVIGTSLGGLAALQTLLSALPASFSIPLVIVQHRLSHAHSEMVQQLQKSSALPVSEPEDKEPMLQGHVYLAPADYHLLLERGSFSLSTEAPVLFARPSINALFDSAAHVYGNAAVGIILTGASDDGAAGLARIKAAGGIAIVENPATAQCQIMPHAAVSAGEIDHVLEIEKIAPCLIRLGKLTSRVKQRA
ncbi:MAG: chemotaxis protein CheB [Gammaproteobacteria bacterium]